MKSGKKIKEELHEYIDNIDDEEILWTVHEEVQEYVKRGKKEKKEDEESLTEKQIKEFDKAVKEMDNGEFTTIEDFKKVMRRWLTK